MGHVAKKGPGKIPKSNRNRKENMQKTIQRFMPGCLDFWKCGEEGTLGPWTWEVITNYPWGLGGIKKLPPGPEGVIELLPGLWGIFFFYRGTPPTPEIQRIPGAGVREQLAPAAHKKLPLEV